MMPTEDSGMDDALYADDGAEEATDEKPESSTESVDEEAAEHPTALLPISAFGGKASPGDTVTMKIVKLHGDEVEVEISESVEEEPETESDDNELRELDEMEV